MHHRLSLRILIALLFTFVTVNPVYSQPNQAIAGERQLLTKHLGNVRIRAQGISNFFSKIALRFDVPIGVEVAAKDDLMKWYEMDLLGQDVETLLNRFVTQHNRYGWQVNDGVINIIPMTDRDPAVNELLQTKINAFSIETQMDCFAFANKLMQTPEISKIMTGYNLKAAGLNFSGLFFPHLGRNFNRKFDHQTLKSILNTAIRESPTAKTWTIKRFEDQRLFIKVDARAES